MTNSDPDKVDFLAFTKAEFSISSTFQSFNFYIALLLSFGVFILIGLSVIRKNLRYKKQGFLVAEKSELKIMLDDIRSSNIVSSQNKMLENKYLFQLFTESEIIDTHKHPESSSNHSVFKKQPIHNHNNNSRENSTSKAKTHLSTNKQLRKSNSKQQKKKNQSQQDNSIHIHKGQISFSQSLSERLPKVQQQQQNPAIHSDQKNNYISSIQECRNTNGITEDQEFYVKENQSDLTNNEEQESHKTSALCSFASFRRPSNLLPGMDNSQLVNVSANYSTIITPGHTQKLMDSSPQNSVVIVLADEKHAFQNDNNQDNNGEKITTNQLQQEFLPTQTLCITANNINNENQLTQIAPLNCSQNQNNSDDPRVIKLDDDETQITKIQEKDQNNRQPIKHSASMISRKNTDLSISQVNDSSLSQNIKQISFFKQISRLCLRHNIFINTFLEDSVLFPRVLKCVIIHCNICLLLLAGSFVQIYYYNSEISHLRDKYHESFSTQIVKPSSSPESFLREFSLSFEVSLFLIAGSIGLTIFSKSDPQILFINSNNLQLQRNLLEVVSNQSYKILFSCFFAFVLSAFCFVQFFAFFQVLPSDFILRWALISFIVLFLVFIIFDILYFSFLILLRFRSSFSPRCLNLYQMLLSKAAWWAL